MLSGLRFTKITENPNNPIKPILIREVSSLSNESELCRKCFIEKFENVFTTQGRSKNHRVHSVFKDTLVPFQEKGWRVPIHIQDKVRTEIKKLIREEHILKLIKCTSDHFVALLAIRAKKDGSIKLAMDAKPINARILKYHYQISNLLEQ